MITAVLGTGMVGRAHAARLADLGHEVRLGTQDVERTRERPDQAAWLTAHPAVTLATFADAVTGADLVIETLNGQVAVEALTALSDPLAGAILVDVANPLDFSTGRLTLTVCNTDSLAEQIQRALPGTRVVKGFCHVTAEVQVDPAATGAGAHDFFLAGDDVDAKAAVARLARGYGWKEIVDVGDIAAARGLEMMLPMWLNLMNALGTDHFGWRIVR